MLEDPKRDVFDTKLELIGAPLDDIVSHELRASYSAGDGPKRCRDHRVHCSSSRQVHEFINESTVYCTVPFSRIMCLS